MNIDFDLLNTTIDFQVYPSSIIGDNFKGCKVVDNLSHSTASQLGLISPPAMHSQVYHTLPPELQVADDYTSYRYLKVQLADGSFTIIGDPWIIASSIKTSGTGKIIMTWEGMSNSDLEELKRITQKNMYPPSSAVYHP